jgi:hypothetical protein
LHRGARGFEMRAAGETVTLGELEPSEAGKELDAASHARAVTGDPQRGIEVRDGLPEPSEVLEQHGLTLEHTSSRPRGMPRLGLADEQEPVFGATEPRGELSGAKPRSELPAPTLAGARGSDDRGEEHERFVVA